MNGPSGSTSQKDWQSLVALCLADEAHLSPKEKEFLGSIGRRTTLTAKQLAWLESIATDLPNRDLHRLKEELSGDRLEALAESLLGTPNQDTLRRSEWRWGAKGSAALAMRDAGGRKRGSFYTHEAELGGSSLDLIMFGKSCNLREAIKFAKHWLGWDSPDYKPLPVTDEFLAEQARKRAEQQRQADAAAADRITIARRLHGYSVPVSGTVAERYLVATRCIPTPADGWPDAVRYLAASNSLLLSATSGAGDVQAVQRVFLSQDAEKIDAEALAARNLRSVKQTNGVTDGAAVRLPGDPLGPLLLAEGPETGLSAWVATRHETWIALGSIRKIDAPRGRRIIICRDDDRRHAPADVALRRLVADWTRDGISVAVASPWASRRFDKSDLNDVIKTEGVEGVRNRIARAVNPASVVTARRPITEVRRALDEAVAGFFDVAALWEQPEEDRQAYAFPDGEDHKPEEDTEADPPPVHAIKVDVGAGKTRAAYRYAAAKLETMRAAGDNRAIAVAVPTHKLGDEQAELFNSIAAERGSKLVARVWRGMDAADPGHSDATDDSVRPDLKTRMCRNPEAVKAARDAGVPVYQAACRKKAKGEDAITCPFFGVCGYQKQREAAADLWIVPHELLFLAKPTALGKLALLVVDEACWSDGLEGVNGRATSMEIDELRKPDAILSSDGAPQRINTDRLHYLRNRLLDGLEGQTDGPLLRESLHGDLNHANAGEAYTLEWKRLVDPDLHPGLSEQERQERVRKAKGNARVMRVARVWKAATALLRDGGPQSSGWLAVASEPDEEGRMARVLHIKGRRDVRKGWLVPTLLLDATMNVDLVRPYWPQVELTAELLAEAPHQRVRQVVDRAFSKSMIDPLDEEEAAADPALGRRRTKNLRTVHAILCREARSYAPQRVLVVTQKAVKEALPSFGPLPANVELAHHNAVAGRDEWGPQPDRPGISALIVVGRTAPSPGSVHRLAEALTGSAIERLEGGWYHRGDAVRERLDGDAEAIEAEHHPDPIAEAIRWQICEGELVQIIGRGRGVNRTAENPLDVLVMTDAPVPVPVAETLGFADLDPAPADLMMATAGIALENARHAAEAFAALWPSHEAARKAFQRQAGTSLYKNYLSLQECPSLDGRETVLRGATYQLAGARAQPSRAIFDPSTCADPEAWLTEKLGPLARFEIDRPQPEPDPDPPSPPAPEPTMEEPVNLPAARIERMPPDWIFPAVKDEARAIMPIAGLWRVYRPGRPPVAIEEPPDGWAGSALVFSAFTPTPMSEILRVAHLEAMQESW